MFDTAPAIKVEGVRKWGAQPVFMPRERLYEWMAKRAGNRNRRLSYTLCRRRADSRPRGLGLEIFEEVPDVARVVVAAEAVGFSPGCPAR